MDLTHPSLNTLATGIVLRPLNALQLASEPPALMAVLRGLGLQDQVLCHRQRLAEGQWQVRFYLDPWLASHWLPQHSTLGLCDTLGLDTQHHDCDLEREIFVALLGAPCGFEFPSVQELLASVHIRRHIVQASRRTALAFDTEAAERPQDCWHYDPDCGFTLRPGASLVTALQKATQPALSGTRYAFSCYRATEYVILLGIAQELQDCNPALLADLERQWRARAIMSGRFHDAFLHEYGSMDAPLPAGFYVPGDRLWFRNPDEASANVTGYEGSWVVYQGGGLFSDFWHAGQSYTLTRKCLEIYHWRHGAWQDAQGEWHMDEEAVEARVQASLADPDTTAQILHRMLRYRDPRGVYAEGGCLDSTREYPRTVCPGTASLQLGA